MGYHTARLSSPRNGSVREDPGQRLRESLTQALQVPTSLFSTWQAAQGQQPVCISVGGRGLAAKASGGSGWKGLRIAEVARHWHAMVFIESRIRRPPVRRPEAGWVGPCAT